MLVKYIFSGCLEEHKTPFSFEFFPPRNSRGWESLFTTMKELLPLNPAFVSVTYGAGGTTRENTHNLVTRLQAEGLTVVAHLTCNESSEKEILQILERYNSDNVHNILALRGDTSQRSAVESVKLGAGSKRDFTQAAQLLRFIKKHYPQFCIGVAGYPEGHPDTPNRLQEMDYLKAKVDEGADYIITQMFFDNRDFYDFRERCELAGIRVPIIAGLMPITSLRGMDRMANLVGGSRFPAALIRRLKRSTINNGGEWGSYTSAENNSHTMDSAVSQIGEHWCSEQISDLLNSNVAGIHLYTLNHSSASKRIMKNLGLASYSVVNS